jgi:alpha-tubulin suppressor-like RCC1 family protein
MNRQLRRWMCALPCAAALALSACGGGDAPPPPSPPMIGPAGGTVTGPNGAQVVIPAGALAADTAIAVTQSGAGSPALPAGTPTFGAVYTFTPHGITFALPVTITVPFDAASVPAGVTPFLFKTNAAGAWERVPNATVSAGTITAQVSSFSWGVPAPLISVAPADVAVTEPASATFSVTALGIPPFTYQWEKSDDGGVNFVAIGGATDRTYTTGATTIAADNGDRYRVLVSNDPLDPGATSRSSAALLTVTASVIAPAITTQPQGVVAAAGANASFSVVATGTNLVYQWRRDGADIAGQTNASLNLANVQVVNAGSYTVVVSNLIGGTPVNSIVSSVATLTVTSASGTATPKVAAASQHSLALARNGTVYSWGLNTLNELGRTTATSFDTRAAPIPALANVIDIATAGNTSLALLADGTVRAWGSNSRGLLGIGTTAVTAGVQTVSGLSGVTRIAMGYSHALALRNDGTVWAWGANVSGAIGDGTKTDRTTAVQVPGLTNVIAIAGGGGNSFALRADGTVWAWGEANSTNPLLLGQGGSGADQLTPIQVQAVTGAVGLEASETNAFARTAGGLMWAWGQGVPGVFDPTTSTLLPQLLAGLPVPAAHTTGSCWVTTSVNPFGYLLIAQASGVLSGFGAAETPAGGLAVLTGVTDVSGVFCHALAARSDGTVWAAGLNNAGQIGDGTTAQRSAPVQVLGLNLN